MVGSRRADALEVIAWNPQYAEAAGARLEQLTHKPCPTFAERVEAAALSTLSNPAHKKAFTTDDLWLLVWRLRDRGIDPRLNNDVKQRHADGVDWDTARINLKSLMASGKIPPTTETVIDRAEQWLQETLETIRRVVKEHGADPEFLANVTAWLPREIVDAIRLEAVKAVRNETLQELFGSPTALGVELGLYYENIGEKKEGVQFATALALAVKAAVEGCSVSDSSFDKTSPALGRVKLGLDLLRGFTYSVARAPDRRMIKALRIDSDAIDLMVLALEEGFGILDLVCDAPDPAWPIGTSDAEVTIDGMSLEQFIEMLDKSIDIDQADRMI